MKQFFCIDRVKVSIKYVSFVDTIGVYQAILGKGSYPAMIGPFGLDKGPETFWIIFRSSSNYTINIGFISCLTYFLSMLFNQLCLHMQVSCWMTRNGVLTGSVKQQFLRMQF